ncbi:tandem-95 repeat protein [Pontiellaceae bacterium B12227]|nr:tandem-95 repeat protein [Pontiellaceae bacterium B12227]
MRNIKSALNTICIITGLLSNLTVGAQTSQLSLTDSAILRSGANADTPQAWSTGLDIKNAPDTDNYCRISMMKADLSAIETDVDTATLRLYSTDSTAHTLHIFGVKDHAGFQDWTGGATGSATWNAVTTNGLFSPQTDLHLANDPNLVLLGSQMLPGNASGDVLVELSGQALTDLINTDSDNLLSFVFSVQETTRVTVRPHNYTTPATLEIVQAPQLAHYPLYAEAAQLYSNNVAYDLTNESYTYSEIFRTQTYPYPVFSDSFGTPVVSWNNSTFVAFADAGRRIKIAKITGDIVEEAYLDSIQYQAEDFYANSDDDPDNNIVGADFYRMIEADGHHDLCISVDKDGYIHIAGDMHNFPDFEGTKDYLPMRYFNSHCLYWRSDNPGDISSFSFKGDDPTTCPQGYGFTYLQFHKDLNGELYFSSRGFQGDPAKMIRRAQVTSRYDAENGTWSIVGGKAFEPDGYDVTFWEDNAEGGGSYVKMFADLCFDRQNRMHIATGILNYDAEIVREVWAVLTDLLYLQSDDGGVTMKKPDGSVVSMPARAEAGANQAEVIYTTDYLSDTNNQEYLNAPVETAHDLSNNPYVLCKPKHTDGLTILSQGPTKLFGWSQDSGWTDYEDVVSDYQYFFTDPAGVMTVINESKVTRFWDPASNTVVTADWDRVKAYDREYVKMTGNLQVLCEDATTGELVIKRMEITRPGLELITPPIDPVTNHAPEITVKASIDGQTLSVVATDADNDPLTYTWYKEYGNGTVSFSENGTETASSTTVDFSEEYGSYELKVAVSDGHSTRYSSCLVDGLLVFDNFDDGFGNWVSGGADVNLKTNNAVSGDCLHLQDNSGDASSSWMEESVNLSAAPSVRVEFTYVPVSMEPGEDFWLMISNDDGSTWSIIKSFTAGVDFENDVRHTADMIITNGSPVAFTSTVKFRVQCDASGDGDDIFIDNIRISAALSSVAVNSAPIATDASVAVAEDGSVDIPLTGSDIDGDDLTYSVVTAPIYGTFDGTNYTPNANFNGSDSFTFIANDGTADSAPATISITVNAVNDLPMVGNSSVSLEEDGSVTIALTGSDIDGDALTYSVVTAPANGTFDGSTYTPDINFNGSDSFTFVANDGTTDSSPATVSITVNAVNDVPMVGNSSVSLEEDGSVTIALTGSDIDGDALTYSVVTAPANGTFDGSTYTPNTNFNGSDSFTVVANDGSADSAPATVTIAVTAVNDAPTFNLDPIIGPGATQDVVYVDSIAGTDVDGDSLSYSKLDGPDWLTVSPNGDLSGTPMQGDVGFNSFTLLANDGHGGSASATLEIEVAASAATTDLVELLVSGSFESGTSNFVFTGNYGNLPLTASMAGQWLTREINEDSSMDLTDISNIIAGQDGDVSMLFQSSAKRGLVQVIDVSGMDLSGVDLSFSASFAAPGRETLTVSDMASYQVIGFNDFTDLTVDIGGSYAFTGGTYDPVVAKRTIADTELSGSAFTLFTATETLSSDYNYLAVLVGGLGGANNSDIQFVAVDDVQLKLNMEELFPAYDMALSETSVVGSVVGSLSDTLLDDNSYEVITEELDTVPTSVAGHVWTFDVYGAELVTFYVEAHHSANNEGDDFVFSFSTNGTDWTDMVTITNTTDDDTIQWYALPSGLSGPIFVRATDIDRTAGSSVLDSLWIDFMLIASDESSQAPLAANTPEPSDGAADISVDQVLGWTSGSMTATNAVYFGEDPDNLIFQTLELGNGFDPAGLAPATTYYWAVDAMNSSGTTPGPVWSFTTASPDWATLIFDDFEYGWGNWVDGGDQVQLKSNYAVGSQCLNIADDLGDSSSSWLANPLDLSPYSELRINFTYMPVSMEPGETFLLMLSNDDGTSWQTVKAFVAGTDFNNDIREYPEVTVDSASYNFTSNTYLRFQCDASGAWDDIYLDDITISAR